MIYDDLLKRNLPNVLENNMKVEDWPQRRKEILELLSREVYGFSPPPPKEIRSETLFEDENAWAGKAIHREINLSFPTDLGDFSFPCNLVLPKSEKKLPLIVYISFERYPMGKHCPVEEIIDSGFALASFYYKDITSDDDDFSSGLAGKFKRDNSPWQWGKISLWAYAASRVMDYVFGLSEVNKGAITVVGHSRLGKTALWCAAQDQRFAAAVSNNSGCSGAAISRGKKGESIKDITERFPFWFCDNYKKYAGAEKAMPFDQHFLLALTAPRPLYVASAELDGWADPYSEFLSCLAVDEVYKLLGNKGFVHENRFLSPGESLQDGNIAYHLRPGRHYLSRYDWQRFMRYLKKRLV